MNINKVSNTKNMSSQPSFNGGFTENLGTRILESKSKLFRTVSDKFEYTSFTMPLIPLLGVLYGATIVPRYVNAKDKYDRREILTRDFLSITALMFMSNALSTGMSRYFTKQSGFALNDVPSEYEKADPIKKIWFYINRGGMELLNSHEIVAKYSNIDRYANGILDFITFIQAHGGDITKVLSYEKGGVKKHVDAILEKDIKSIKPDEDGIKEIKAAFERAAKAKSPHLEEIYKAFRASDNAFVRHAKTMNSVFAFASMCLLTPAFMIGIEKYNEHVTKKQVAQEKAAKQAKQQVETAKA